MQAMRAWGMSMQELREQEIGPAILSLAFQFKKEVSYPETIRVESELRLDSKLKASFHQKMFAESSGQLACEAQTVWTLFDLKRRRPVAFEKFLFGVRRRQFNGASPPLNSCNARAEISNRFSVPEVRLTQDVPTSGVALYATRAPLFAAMEK